MLAGTGDSGSSGHIVGIGKGAPINDDNINILNSQEGRCDQGVHCGVTVVVPSVNNDLQVTAAIVVRITDRLDVTVDQKLVVVLV